MKLENMRAMKTWMRNLSEDAFSTGPSQINVSSTLLLSYEIDQISPGVPNHNSEAISGLPKIIGLIKSSFLTLDYLFVPYLADESHYGLIGIAPEQHFVFVIDSVNSGYQFPVRKIYDIVLHFLPGNDEEKKTEANATRNVFGQ
jgi:hypothetical protein